MGKVARALPVSDIYGVAENSRIMVWTKELTSKVQHDGGTQVPKEVRAFLHVDEGDLLLWKISSAGILVVTRGTIIEAAVS